MSGVCGRRWTGPTCRDWTHGEWTQFGEFITTTTVDLSHICRQPAGTHVCRCHRCGHTPESGQPDPSDVMSETKEARSE